MRKVTAPADMYISNLEGHGMHLKAGEEREIPDSLYAEFVRVSGEKEVAEVLNTPAPEPEPADEPLEDFTGLSAEDRVSMIEAAIEEIQATGDEALFTATGEPRLEEINSRLDFTISATERDEVWADVSVS